MSYLDLDSLQVRGSTQYTRYNAYRHHFDSEETARRIEEMSVPSRAFYALRRVLRGEINAGEAMLVKWEAAGLFSADVCHEMLERIRKEDAESAREDEKAMEEILGKANRAIGRRKTNSEKREGEE